MKNILLMLCLILPLGLTNETANNESQMYQYVGAVEGTGRK